MDWTAIKNIIETEERERAMLMDELEYIKTQIPPDGSIDPLVADQIVEAFRRYGNKTKPFEQLQHRSSFPE